MFAKNGWIYTTVFGGLPPYKYFGRVPIKREDIIGLLPKVYTLTAVDVVIVRLPQESITVPSGILLILWIY